MSSLVVFYFILIIRCATAVPLLPLRHSTLESQVKFSYPCVFSDHFKFCLHLNYVIISFLFMSMNSSTIYCTIFCVCSDIKSIVYSNYQYIFCFYVFLLEITAFGFSRIACSRVDLNLCTPPIVCTPPFI